MKENNIKNAQAFSDQPWAKKKMLTYCKQGNIQAMFDEYAHLITNGLDEYR